MAKRNKVRPQAEHAPEEKLPGRGRWIGSSRMYFLLGAGIFVGAVALLASLPDQVFAAPRAAAAMSAPPAVIKVVPRTTGTHAPDAGHQTAAGSHG